MRKISAIALCAWILIVAGLHLWGRWVLQFELFGLPAGNLLLWTGFIALPAAQLLGIYHGKNRQRDPRIGVFRFGALGALTISLFWGLLGYGLSGNWSFKFTAATPGFVGSPEAATFFSYISAVTGLLPVVVLVLYLIYRAL